MPDSKLVAYFLAANINSTFAKLNSLTEANGSYAET